MGGGVIVVGGWMSTWLCIYVTEFIESRHLGCFSKFLLFLCTDLTLSCLFLLGYNTLYLYAPRPISSFSLRNLRLYQCLHVPVAKCASSNGLRSVTYRRKILGRASMCQRNQNISSSSFFAKDAFRFDSLGLEIVNPLV
jgi:hypothetical protein